MGAKWDMAVKGMLVSSLSARQSTFTVLEYSESDMASTRCVCA